MRKKTWIVIVPVIAVSMLFIFSSSVLLAQSREQVDIQILSMKFGGTGYVASFVWADLINKNSLWLRATAAETGGTIDNIKLMSKDRDRARKLMGWGDFAAFHSAKNALPPFQVKYNGKLTWMAHVTTFLPHFVATNPNIKIGRDLRGKRIGLPVAGSGGVVLPEYFLRDAWNIYKDVKIEYLGWGNSAKALIDRKVDAAWITGTLIEGKLQPIPGVEEFMASGVDFHIIPAPEDDLRMIRQKTGYPAFGMTVPPGTMHARQKEPVHVSIMISGFFADAELPDDVAYEAVRILFENYKKFGEHHASLKGLSPERISLGGDKEECHPGAARFYKEKGLKIGF
jgi:TRAP transporter TAXI family solute receptor